MQQRHARRCRPKWSSSTITLVEVGMSDALLGNQARAGYGSDNERLRSAVCCCLPSLYLFKTRRNFLEAKLQENCHAQTTNRRYFQHAHFIPILGVGKRGGY